MPYVPATNLSSSCILGISKYDDLPFNFNAGLRKDKRVVELDFAISVFDVSQEHCLQKTVFRVLLHFISSYHALFGCQLGLLHVQEKVNEYPIDSKSYLIVVMQ